MVRDIVRIMISIDIYCVILGKRLNITCELAS